MCCKEERLYWDERQAKDYLNNNADIDFDGNDKSLQRPENYNNTKKCRT